jgi:hypothetical protein
VHVGVKLFRELGDRAKRLEAEVQVYREAVITLAARGGQDVPTFLRPPEGPGLTEVEEANLERLREWLARLVSGSQAPGRARPSSGSGARGGRGGGGRRRAASRNRREPVAGSDMES